jgi:hypothetical protein
MEPSERPTDSSDHESLELDSSPKDVTTAKSNPPPDTSVVSAIDHRRLGAVGSGDRKYRPGVTPVWVRKAATKALVVW